VCYQNGLDEGREEYACVIQKHEGEWVRGEGRWEGKGGGAGSSERLRRERVGEGETGVRRVRGVDLDLDGKVGP
jgi:hypothetical protein